MLQFCELVVAFGKTTRVVDSHLMRVTRRGDVAVGGIAADHAFVGWNIDIHSWGFGANHSR